MEPNLQLNDLLVQGVRPLRLEKQTLFKMKTFSLPLLIDIPRFYYS